MKNLFALFIAFSKIGGFTFGGGYAMLELMKMVHGNRDRGLFCTVAVHTRRYCR